MRLTICLLTYKRTSYACRTLGTALDNLITLHPIRVHIADDGSDRGHVEKILAVARDYVHTEHITFSNSMRGGYGRNVNLATQVMHSYSDYILMLEDDWELRRVFNIDELILDMESSPCVGAIRLGYLSWTQDLYGKLVRLRDTRYLHLSPDSPEHHVFAGHPRLEKVSYQRAIGPWPEGLAPGHTEFDVAHIEAARRGVYWPMDLVHPRGDLFSHIGSVRSY